MKIIGIDPGLKGAVAYLTPEELIIEDMPIYELIIRGKKRNKIDDHGLLKVLKEFDDCDMAYVELVKPIHGVGFQANFTFGWGCGTLQMALVALKIPFTYVVPQKWKKTMQVTKAKDTSLIQAKQLFPLQADYFARKKDDGRAEAALLAEYGRRELNQK